MNLRHRLVGAATGVTLITLGGAFSAVYVAVNRSQEAQLDRALLDEAAEEAREASALGGDELAISDRPGPAANDTGPLTKYGAIYDARGEPIASTPTFRGAPPAWAEVDHPMRRCFDLRLPQEHLRAVLAPIPAHPGVVLLLAAPRADLDGDEVFLQRAMVAVFAAALLWSAVLASWVVRRLTRHHERIAQVAQRVAAGDLEARVGDVTGDGEDARLARDVDDMIDRLAALLASQQRFIAYAAHELRSPLTTLYGELAHALRRERDAPAYRAAIEESLDSARRLQILAEDLLALARLDAARDAPSDPVDLGALAREAARHVEGEAAARGARVAIEGVAPSPPGHAPELLRLVRNLIENAVRHSPPGGVVRVRLGGDAVAARITVTDEGPGVPPVERERIFEPFYRGPGARSTDRDGDRPGAGLGLAIARGIARAHRGDVDLASDHAGTGACFEVHLPL